MFLRTLTAFGVLATVTGTCAFGQSADTTGGSSQPSAMDRHVMTTLAQGNMAEIKMGKLTLQKSHNAQVRQVAKTIIKDHSQAQDALKQVAKSENVKLPKDIAPKDRAAYSKLSGLSGAAYDKSYITQQVHAHDMTVALVNKEQAQTSNAPFKAFLAQTAPKIQMHTNELHQIQTNMMRARKGGMTTGMKSTSGM